MKAIGWLFGLVVLLAAGAAYGREVQLNVIELDPDDIACGLSHPAIQQQVRQAMSTMKAIEVAKSDHALVVSIATVKRPLDCASVVNVTLRRVVPLADGEKFRTRDKLAHLELCRHGGIVVSPVKDHGRDFLKQVERSVMICFGQLVF